jgi:CHAT domain-containing protein/Flp pilus assembly protein TadD
LAGREVLVEAVAGSQAQVARAQPDMREFDVRALSAVLAACGILWSATLGQPPAGADTAPVVTAAQKEKLRERDRLDQESRALAKAGRLGEAVAAAERCLALERAVLGAAHPDVLVSVQWLAGLHERRENWSAARMARREAVDLLVKLRGSNDWTVTDARLALADAERFAGMPTADRAALRRAREANETGMRLHREGRYAEAERLYREALAVRKATLGDRHTEYAQSLNNLAMLYRYTGRYAEAEPLLRETLAAYRAAVGDRHPVYAIALDNLGLLYRAAGRYGEAEPLQREALAVRKAVLGDRHPDYAKSLNNLALLYESTARYEEAELLLREAAAAYKASGGRHPDYVQSLNNLAVLYQDTGRLAEAEPLYRNALAVWKATLGNRHPNYAIALNNLATLYQDTSRYGEAEPLLREALAVRKAVLGNRHPDYAQSLNNLGQLYWAAGRYGEAEPLLREALAVRKAVLGNRHPDYAMALNNLAALYQATGRLAEAEPLYREALAVRQAIFGDRHPSYAEFLNNLAALYEAAGRLAEAEPLYRQALATIARHLDTIGLGQTEAAQFGFLGQRRYFLSSFLSATACRGAPDAYARVLVWKGQVFLRQRRQRELARLAADPDCARLATELAALGQQLATLVSITPTPDQAEAYKARIVQLGDRGDRLEVELAVKSAVFREQKSWEALTPDDLRKLLPAGTALVDYLVYDHSAPERQARRGWQHENRLAAFVVRPDRPAERVELGPWGPVAKAINAWRATVKRAHPVTSDDDAALVLRKTLWGPVAKHLGGISTVFVSPDQDLARLPFAALPGSRPNCYLIEEIAIAVLPVAQFLPELVKPTDKVGAPSLLVVGGVDYGSDPGKPAGGVRAATAARGGRATVWAPLPATREEVIAIKDSFEQAFPNGAVKALRAGQATEQAVRQLAGKHRWLHLATHGFFTPPVPKTAGADRGPVGFDDARRAAVLQHPGLQSGIVLAGANRPPAEGQDDGILTALEVSHLDLRRAELVVLSACETGLGQAAGGEGLLGLQRAFQVAGARTVVASLWAVDDDATRKLMVQCYEHWWERKKGKLAGLVEAQRWLLREGVRRGLVREDEAPKNARPPRTPPYYWAAFVLSGDWR